MSSMRTGDRPNYDRPDYRFDGGKPSVTTASTLNIVAAIWLIVTPFLFAYADLEVALWNQLIVGGLILVLAGIRVANPRQYAGLSWANVVLGLWLIISPFFLGFAELAGPLWNHVVVGVIVAGLAIVSAVNTRTALR